MPIQTQTYNKKQIRPLFKHIEHCRDWLLHLAHNPKDSTPETEKALESFLFTEGEPAIIEFLKLAEDILDFNIGSLSMPPIQTGQVAPAGFSKAENGQLFAIPSILEEYEYERLRLMAKVAVQKILKRKIVVNVGIGYIGTANIAVATQAKNERDESPYR